jgi:hypothetical protein
MAAALAVAVSLAALEVGVRAWMPQLPFTEAAHDVLFLAPDRVVGWKHAERFAFSWNGRNPYCIEFKVQVATNSFGFRDDEWTVHKPPHVLRIAVLGDSFIEAIQVPQERTAIRELERRIRARFPGRTLETLNFGVSNYGVGQYLMVYEQYVRQFAPDYVVVFASYLNFTRTTQRELSSRLQEFYALNVRPTYVVRGDGSLVYVPADDYEKYERGVATLLQTEFSVDRSKTVPPLATWFALPHWALHILSQKARPAPTPHDRSRTEFPDVDLNYRILEQLHREVEADGATLVFADAFEYLERYGVVRGSGALAARNRAFIEGRGAGYVDLSPALRAASENPQYECDMHFNESGNAVVGRQLAEWFEPALAARR